MNESTAYEYVCAHARQTALVGAIDALLGWDERVWLPPAAGAYRAEQIAFLAGLQHDRWTDAAFGDWLDQLTSSPLAADRHSDEGTTIRQLKRARDRRVKLPRRLVEELARVCVVGQQVWSTARPANDFSALAPVLERIVALKREEAAALAIGATAYDALLDEYEPGASTAEITTVLTALRDELVPLVAELAEAPRRPDVAVLRGEFPVDQQAAFGAEVARAIGFDFDSGRLDTTLHPFCTELGPHDCRITTRYDRHDFGDGLFSILHEAGHGLYAQGLRAEWFGLPPGSAVSLGIHESQSRLWENQVGRSRSFWEHFLPRARQRFAALKDVDLDSLYFAINHIAPSLIRTEADEATYNLHILVRFELEQALLADEVRVAELPAAWREKYRRYLGIEPPDDRDGVLQDIHWSGGAIGYFPTYSLGNLYAAQFVTAARRALGDLDSLYRQGEFRPLLEWLRSNIHKQGECYSAAEFCQRITGEPLSHRYLIDYLRAKLGPLYGLPGY